MHQVRTCFDRKYSRVTCHQDRCPPIGCLKCSAIQAVLPLAISGQLLSAVLYEKRQGLSLLFRSPKKSSCLLSCVSCVLFIVVNLWNLTLEQPSDCC